MFRSVACTLTIVSICAMPLPAQSVEQPPAVTLAGGQSLPKSAEAIRTVELGVVELYGIAIYADASPPNRAQLASPSTPKVLRIAVAYKDDLRRRASFDWRSELIPIVEPAAAVHLKGTFAPLQHGDVVLIEYVPERGTTVRVNRSVAVENADHDLMLAFLDRWIGQRPVSEDLKRALLGR